MPTPLRHKASAAHPPTPPTPMICHWNIKPQCARTHTHDVFRKRILIYRWNHRINDNKWNWHACRNAAQKIEPKTEGVQWTSIKLTGQSSYHYHHVCVPQPMKPFIAVEATYPAKPATKAKRAHVRDIQSIIRQGKTRSRWKERYYWNYTQRHRYQSSMQQGKGQSRIQK